MSEPKRFERMSVEVSEEGLAELDRGRRNVFVPRREIREIRLSYGLGSERPLITGILGVLVLILGSWPFVELYLAFREGNTFYIENMTASAFLLLGGWLIYFSLKKRLHLLVQTANQRRKILFPKKVQEEDLVELLRVAEHDFGYSIYRSVGLEDLSRRGVLQGSRAVRS